MREFLKCETWNHSVDSYHRRRQLAGLIESVPSENEDLFVSSPLETTTLMMFAAKYFIAYYVATEGNKKEGKVDRIARNNGNAINDISNREIQPSRTIRCLFRIVFKHL